jgi:hypothetical protein
MVVFLCLECYYDYCDVWESPVKIVDDELKAMEWVDEFQKTEREWRTYTEYTVE